MKCIFIIAVILSSSLADKDISETVETIKSEQFAITTTERSERDGRMLAYFEPSYPRYYPTSYPYYETPMFRFETPYSPSLPYVTRFSNYENVARPNNTPLAQQTKKKPAGDQPEMTIKITQKERFSQTPYPYYETPIFRYETPYSPSIPYITPFSYYQSIPQPNNSPFGQQTKKKPMSDASEMTNKTPQKERFLFFLPSMMGSGGGSQRLVSSSSGNSNNNNEQSNFILVPNGSEGSNSNMGNIYIVAPNH
ncbi:hypothetical protein QYM36_011680 [Artemia franciscana]|uniref:Uncharacterized protein n=1 Tax=Artemia franciscana TaxID=6661 RepID=A0AA88L4Z0_ARTSF|nr:hypothetical protein QYM36_011680 [Artemia franciscana]